MVLTQVVLHVPYSRRFTAVCRMQYEWTEAGARPVRCSQVSGHLSAARWSKVFVIHPVGPKNPLYMRKRVLGVAGTQGAGEQLPLSPLFWTQTGDIGRQSGVL